MMSPGAMALVVGIREAFESQKKIVAQVELDVARNADDDPAGQELKDSLGGGDTEQDGSVEQKLAAGDASVQIVGSFAQNEREQDPDAIGEEDTKRAREVSPSIASHVEQQRSEVLLVACVSSVDEILSVPSRTATSSGRSFSVPDCKSADSLP